MADIETRRREARVRRILENTENRLARITGVSKKIPTDDSHRLLHKTTSNIPQNLTTTSTATSASAIQTPSELNWSAVPDDSVNTLFHNPNIPNESTETVLVDTTTTQRSSIRNLTLLILAGVVALVLVALRRLAPGVSEKLHINKVFLPLFAYELLELVYGGDDINALGLMPPMLAMVFSRYHIAREYVLCLNIVSKLTQDVMVYFFVFTCSYNIFQLVL